MILAGDIGGTKTNLALYALEGLRLVRCASASLSSREFPGLIEAVSSFLLSPRPPIEAAGFGVAGPVEKGRVKATNLPWVVDQAALAKFLGISAVRILNDLEAMAWGIERLEPEDMDTLQPGSADPDGNAAVIAAGTGLGEALLLRHGGRFVPRASEGGHASFAPSDGEMDAFLSWMRTQIGHVSVERVASGIGLERMYQFFHEPEHGGSEPHLAAGADVAAGVAREAAAGTCGGCGRAFGMFLRCYGSEAGNLALKAAATAGVFIGGGIAMKNIEAMKDGRFMKAFRDKGRFEEYLDRIPVRIIRNEATPLLGAALAAARAAGRIP